MRVNMNKTKVMICGERQKPMRLQDGLVVYVVEVLVVIQYSVLVVRSGYARSVVAYWQHYCTSLKQWASAKLCSAGQEMELRNFCSSFAPPIFGTAAIFFVTVHGGVLAVGDS